MLRAIRILLCTVFLTPLATVAAANTLERIFTQANVVDERTEQNVHYLLPLGRVKNDRKAGRAAPSHFERLQGNLAVVTHGLVIRALLTHHAQRHDAGELPRIGNTSISVLGALAPHTVELLDCTRHLDSTTQHDTGSLSGG